MTADKRFPELPVPDFYDPEKVQSVWKVPYEQRAGQARAWAEEHGLQPAAQDEFRLALFLVDVQNTFCLPDFELFVAGRSGNGAVEDSRRLAEFIYRNLGVITEVNLTLDTHQAMQIFHAAFLVDAEGNHPPANTMISAADVQQGRWRFNPAAAASLGIDPEYGQRHLEHYVQTLAERKKFDLIVWPYHAMLGGIGHALVASVEEALFFYTLARQSQPELLIKGREPLTEHYSAVGPEILEGPDGRRLAEKNEKFIQKVLEFDAVVVAGQAKSHCVNWTVSDLLEQIRARDGALAKKVYLLEDCTSAVVVPGVVDFTEPADEAFARFADAGIRLVRSTEPIREWPGMG